ncbi:hypothetical protein [Streptomyces albus]|uniref:hypothetical protein n=1 Tax=Streptomyces albus TaxID=1888 RepID=UPI0006E3AD07|nr:hypothetical protein [Streptomyces albus]
MSRLLHRIRRTRTRNPHTTGRDRLPDAAGHVYSDLTDGLPDEDLTEDLTDSLELYVMGSKPRCEESEYLELMEDAIERMARAR